MLIRYINLFVVFWIFVLTVNCSSAGSSSDDLVPGETNSNSGDLTSSKASLILVEVAPTGQTPEVIPNAHDAICRSGMPDHGTQEGRTEDTTISVSPNWFSMGLNIANSSKDYSLIIKKLVFIISDQLENEILNGKKEINSGYCGTDPLYTVLPSIKLPYEPSRRNYVNNLTLFVDDVPIPNDKDDTSNALPTYRVQLVLHGHFVDKDKNFVDNFKKEIFFSYSRSVSH